MARTSSANKDPHGLLSAPIGAVMTRMAVPMALGIVAILCFNLVDTWFIGMMGTQELAAVSFTFPVTFAITSLSMGMGIGVSTVLARLLGAGEHHRAARLATDGVALAVISVSSVALLGLLTIDPLFRLLGADAALLVLIREYMVPWYLGIPLLVTPMVSNSAIRATGDTTTPSLVMALAGAVNGVMDPLLIFGIGPFPEWGMRGAAIASVISWALACWLALYRLRHRERLLLLERPQWRQVVHNWRQIIVIGLPAALSNSFTPLANAVVVFILAGVSVEAVAAFGAGIRIEALLLIGIMSLSAVIAPFIAQNTGAGLDHRAGRAIRSMCHRVLMLQLALYALIAAMAPWIASWFSNDARVSDLLSFFLRVLPLAYGAQGVVMLLAASLNGLHRPWLSLSVNAMRLFALVVPAAVIGAAIGGAKEVFIALACANVCAGMIAYAIQYRLTRLLIFGAG